MTRIPESKYHRTYPLPVPGSSLGGRHSGTTGGARLSPVGILDSME
ncbi:MAG: hypothetical protein WC314_05815 [Vulcanimicrobiota bacterium]